MKEATLIPPQAVTGDVTSAAFQLGDLYRYSVHAIFSGSDRAGSLIIQGSNDGANWVAVSTTAVSSAADKMLTLEGHYRYVRAFWDNTSGTGNLTVYLVAKENIVKGA